MVFEKKQVRVIADFIPDINVFSFKTLGKKEKTM